MDDERRDAVSTPCRSRVETVDANRGDGMEERRGQAGAWVWRHGGRRLEGGGGGEESGSRRGERKGVRGARCAVCGGDGATSAGRDSPRERGEGSAVSSQRGPRSL